MVRECLSTLFTNNELLSSQIHSKNMYKLCLSQLKQFEYKDSTEICTRFFSVIMNSLSHCFRRILGVSYVGSYLIGKSINRLTGLGVTPAGFLLLFMQVIYSLAGDVNSCPRSYDLRGFM